MGIRMTINDTDAVTLADLFAQLPHSKAAKEVAALREEVERWKADYMGAAELVATLYEAVTGNTGGPVRGVVEDVQDTIANLTAERDLFKKETLALVAELPQSEI